MIGLTSSIAWHKELKSFRKGYHRPKVKRIRMYWRAYGLAHKVNYKIARVWR